MRRSRVAHLQLKHHLCLCLNCTGPKKNSSSCISNSHLLKAAHRALIAQRQFCCHLHPPQTRPQSGAGRTMTRVSDLEPIMKCQASFVGHAAPCHQPCLPGQPSNLTITGSLPLTHIPQTDNPTWKVSGLQATYLQADGGGRKFPWLLSAV